MRKVLAIGVWAMVLGGAAAGKDLYVSPSGDDGNPGTKDKPFATLARARDAAREAKAGAAGGVTVYLREGTYYLREPLVLGPRDSGTQDAPLVFAAFEGEKAVVSGGVRLELTWRAYKNGIMQADVPAVREGKLSFTQLFVDGRRQRLARYPNYDPGRRPFGGTAADAISPQRVRTWADPVGAFVHGLHGHSWGSYHYRITGVDAEGKVKLEGGYQVNRKAGLHAQHRFVEGVLEELDAPGEWYLDAGKGVLYFLPPAGVDLAKAKVEAVVLKQLLELRGSGKQPVKHVSLRGLTFTHAAWVFLEPYDNLLRGDWAISRTGAAFLEGTEDCSLAGCSFDQVGGNAVFLNGYNRRAEVRDCLIAEAGESGVCLVGDSDAVRSPSTWEHQIRTPPDTQPGPRTPDYPADCTVANNRIHHIGRVGKQTAGVFLSMSSRITVSHNTIHDVPRAGICINDGTWGGHVVEFNDLWETVQETGDHGPFNSWGRDRFWSSGDKKLSLLDACETTHVRNNRIHGRGNWGIDLDDGSSNYHVYNNLCLGLGIKFREGYLRRMENNILIHGPGHFHVWYKDSQDVIARNIIVSDAGYKFIGVDPKSAKEFDYNVFWDFGRQPTVQGVGKTMTIAQWQAKGFDAHSVVADPTFVDPAKGDYSVKPGSPALRLGFKNFPMDQFGVTDKGRVPGRIAIHANVPYGPSGEAAAGGGPEETPLLGAAVTDIYSDGIQSATGLGDKNGVYLASVPAGSAAAKAGLKTGDVILACGGKGVRNVAELMALLGQAPGGRNVEVTIYRDQKRQALTLPSSAGGQ